MTTKSSVEFWKQQIEISRALMILHQAMILLIREKLLLQDWNLNNFHTHTHTLLWQRDGLLIDWSFCISTTTPVCIYDLECVHPNAGLLTSASGRSLSRVKDSFHLTTHARTAIFRLTAREVECDIEWSLWDSLWHTLNSSVFVKHSACRWRSSERWLLVTPITHPPV